MSSRTPEFATIRLPVQPTETAPDGSAVRVLLGLTGGTMAHFELPAGATSRAVTHRTVGSLVRPPGRGELWRKQSAREEVAVLEPGVCVTLPGARTFRFVPRKPTPWRLLQSRSRGGPATRKSRLCPVRGSTR